MFTFAFGSVPKDGGTFTFYRNMRPALADFGVDIRCVSVGKEQAQLWEPDYVDEGCVLLAPETRKVKRQAMEFAAWCETEDVDIVMGINSEAILSALPHLPERIRCLSRCANSFDHGYRITLSGRERLAAIVAQTPRQERDLVRIYGADPGKIRVIPNGIDPAPFDEAARGTQAILALGFLGRLEHNQKGILHLPKIVEGLRRRGVLFRLRIAGKGVHRERLERELADSIHRGEVKFVGALRPEEVPHFLAGIDGFLFTSHFEGCPNALLEAMMAGCVPVAWMIRGITDYIIEDGVNGFLVPMSDCEAFAECVSHLAEDRAGLCACSKAAAEAARRRFSAEGAAQDYANLFREVMEVAPLEWAPRPWAKFRVDPAFRSWRNFIPRSVKSTVKEMLFPAVFGGGKVKAPTDEL